MDEIVLLGGVRGRGEGGGGDDERSQPVYHSPFLFLKSRENNLPVHF